MVKMKRLRRVRDKSDIVMAIVNDGIIVGRVKLRFSSSYCGPLRGDEETILLHSFKLAERFRGVGIGSEVVKKCVEMARRTKRKALVLDCFADRINFYLRCGLKPTSLPGPIGGKRMMVLLKKERISNG